MMQAILSSSSPLLDTLILNWCKGFETIVICLPNLKNFSFQGHGVSICFTSAPKLSEADIFLEDGDIGHSNSNRIQFCHNMSKFQILSIGGHVWKSFNTDGLENVKTLHTPHMDLGDYEQVSGLVHLINSCPKLQILSVYSGDEEFETNPVVTAAAINFLQRRSFSIDMLQSFSFYMFGSRDTELVFLRFILAVAPVLEEAFILNGGVAFDDELVELMKRYPRASLTAELHY